jgi:hypothetical protein
LATTTYEPIATYTVPSAQASYTFSSIPQTYTDLVLIINMQSSYTGDSGNGARLQFNGDTGNNYSDTNLRGNGSSASSYRLSSNSYIQLGLLPSSGGGTPAGALGTGIAHIQNYSNSSTFKTVLGRTNNSYAFVEASVGMWRNPAPITSITYFGDGNILAGSTFTLYGIANADIGAKATGGVITYDNTYYYHTFGASGTFTPQQSLTADILVVAGGGGTGSNFGSGGGAGGLLGFASQSLTTTGYTVTVGSGGAGNSSGAGSNGGNSQFGALTTVIGGGTGQYNGSSRLSGSSGGSGGGANAGAGGTFAGTSGQGNAGGAGDSATNGGNGGGGGSGAAGSNGTFTVSGNGGIGLNTYSSWATVTGTGVSGYYAAGGGGGAFSGNQTSAGLGGLGGGGNGGRDGSVSATAGIANTGGGGGGAGAAGSPGTNGGSGVVIIRYLKA